MGGSVSEKRLSSNVLELPNSVWARRRYYCYHGTALCASGGEHHARVKIQCAVCSEIRWNWNLGLLLMYSPETAVPDY